MIERPDTIEGKTPRIKTGCGWLYLTYNDDKEYKEVFCKLGKSGGCASSFLDGIGRLITFALNAGIPVNTIVRSLRGNRCHSPYINTLSCVDAIAEVLEKNSPSEENK
jgi:ribonucleoside-diphosphate reductase alpha chain